MVVAKVPDLGERFRKLRLDGSILIYDSNNSHSYGHNTQRNTTAFLPDSIFKIFNSLLALEIAFVADDLVVLP